MPSPIDPRPAGRDAGFTLLELLVVVLIVGLVLGMLATGARGGDPRLALEASASRIGNALATARSEAILHDRPVRVLVAGKEKLPPGVRESFSGPEKNSIVFQGDGSASGGVITLAGRGGRASIAVDWLTGRIVVEDKGNGTERG